MILPIITYPQETGIEFAPDVRIFDNELFTFIDNLKETATIHSLEALSAAQVGSYYNLVVYKDDYGEFKEIINPRIIKHEEQIKTTEYTTYFPNLSANMIRYNKITIVYEDKNAQQKTMKVEGRLSIILQRKIDYLYGANFLIVLKGKEREEFENKLQIKKSDFDIFLKFSNYIMIVMFLAVMVALFIESIPNLWEYQLYSSFLVMASILISLLKSSFKKGKWILNIGHYSLIAISIVRLSALMFLNWILF